MKRDVLLSFLLFCVVVSLQAQRVNRTYDNVSLSEVLLQLGQEQTGYTISFIYNELEDFRITTTINNKKLPDAIQQMIGFYPVRMTVDHDDKEIFVECVQKTPTRYKGTVVDEQNQPLPFANVILLSAEDSTLITGGVTNESGYFAIPIQNTATNIILRISFIGYSTLYLPCTVENLGTIQLKPETQTIKGVVVEGERPKIQLQGNSLMMNVEGTVMERMGTAEDVLSRTRKYFLKKITKKKS